MQRSRPARLTFWILSWEAEVKWQLQPLQLSWAGVAYPDRHISVTHPSPLVPDHLHSWAQAQQPLRREELTGKKKNTGLSFKTLRLVCSASFCFHFHPRASLSELLQNSQQSGGKVIPVERNTNKIKWLKLKMPTPRRTGGVWVCMCVSMAAIVDLADMCAAAAHVCVRVCAAG